jgi:hypothetical protein
MTRIVALSAAIILAFVGAAPPAHHRAVSPVQPPTITSLDARRSFVITDLAILSGFTFERVLDQLTAGTNTTAAQLYRQWFDTQNPKPGKADPAGPHCDDFMVNGQPTFNGFPRRCPTSEGSLAATPFTSGEYIPIAVVNRFDQTTPDGSNCGQYRMVFARKVPKGQRLHIIFEAVLPNPTPGSGLSGCRAVALFWAGLSKIDAAAERRAKIESFYFDGLAGFRPVVHPENFTAASGGGIRTTQLGAEARARMYQFRIAKDCVGGGCTVRMAPDGLPNLPFGRLFDSSVDTSQQRAFQDAFVGQVPNLAVRDANEYFMAIPAEFLLGESNPLDGELAFVFDTPFNRSKMTSPAFRNRIVQALSSIGSTLTPEQIIQRAESQNCVGCHTLSGAVGEGVVFPHSIDGIQQITEDALEDGELGVLSRYQISPALRDVFVPHRIKILIDFLNSGKAPVRSQ